MDTEVNNERTGAGARHEAAWLLLPWLANATLANAERDAVQAHVNGCLSCRRELANLRALAALVKAPVGDQRCEDALRRLHTRIVTRTPARASAPWAAAAMMVMVAGLVSMLSVNTESSVAWLKNTGLSMMSQTHIVDSSSRAVRAHLVFYDNITERQLRALLLSVGADLIEGPTPHGVYTIAFDHSTGEPDVYEALSKLRHSRRVVYAEPVIPTSVADW